MTSQASIGTCMAGARLQVPCVAAGADGHCRRGAVSGTRMLAGSGVNTSRGAVALPISLGLLAKNEASRGATAAHAG